MQIGYIGLGKMGKNMVFRLLDKGYQVVAWNRSPGPRQEVQKKGAVAVETIKDLASELAAPRVVWLMTPPASIAQNIINQLSELLEPGDTVIDGTNNIYTLGPKHEAQLGKKGIHFLDAGTSGGPSGARNGACIMVGGKKEVFTKHEQLFKDLCASKAYQFFPGAGAGHFVKMVHNGIEYGMMQAIAEGFNLMKQSDYQLNLQQIARVYNQQSVIESRLIGWLNDAYQKYGVELKNYDGTVGHLGEGQWTVETAQKLGIPLQIIEASLKFRQQSGKNPTYTGRILEALRTEFGGKRGPKDKPYI